MEQTKNKFNVKINGKQVNLVIAKMIEADVKGNRAQLEYIEYKCGYVVNKLEDLFTWQLPQVLKQLEEDSK